MRVPMVPQRRVIYRAGSEFDTYWREFNDGSWDCCLFVGAHCVAYCHSAISQSVAYDVCVDLLGVSGERVGE